MIYAICFCQGKWLSLNLLLIMWDFRVAQSVSGLQIRSTHTRTELPGVYVC